MDNYFANLGYVDNVPSRVLVAVIETALEGGYEYVAENYHGRYNLAGVAVNATSMSATVNITDSMTHTVMPVVYDADRHTINTDREYFSVSAADYVCEQMVKILFMRKRIFGCDSPTITAKFSHCRVSPKILRSMVISMDDDRVIFRKSDDLGGYTTEERGNTLIMTTVFAGLITEVLYNRYENRIEILDGSIGPTDANTLCSLIKNFR